MLDSDPKAIQENSFPGTLERDGNTAMFFIIKKAKEAILDFSQGAMRIL